MFALIVTEKGGTPKRVEFDKDEVTIGRVPGNDVILPKGNVSKRHSRVVRQDGRFFVVDLKSTNGTYLNGRRITTPSVIRPGDKIYVGDFVVVVEMDGAAGAVAAPEMEPGAIEPPPMPVASNAAATAGIGPGTSPSPLETPPPLPSRSIGAQPVLTEGSVVEPIPLHEDPSESLPPPRMQPSAAVRNAMTQSLGSSPLAGSPTGVGPGTSPPSGGRGTQPPSRPGSGPLAGRPSGNTAPPGNRTLGGAGPRLPGSAQTGGGPLGGGVPARAPMGANGGSVGASEPRRQPSLISPAEPMDPSLPGSAGIVAPFLPGNSGPPTVATLNIAPSLVEAVIESHKALTSQIGNEPTPPGREYAELLAEIVSEARADGASAPDDHFAEPGVRASVRSAVEAVARRRAELPASVTVDRLVRDATAEIAGAGAIESALEEADVTTVVVDATGRVLVGRGDALGPSSFWFSGPDAVQVAVDRLLARADSPRNGEAVVDATLEDGARLVALLPPVAIGGPTLVYERHAARPASLIELAAREMLTTAAVTLLGHALAARRNVFVTGPRGSGRTTVLGALVAAVSASDRCIVVDDGRASARAFPGVTTLDARGDWKRALDLARRLRPQRLVIAGTDDPAANGALVANMATGAEGSLATLEGASPLLALGRLAAAAAASGAMTREEAFVRLTATRPLLIHTARLGDGTCRVVSISEARASDGGGLMLDDVFVLRFDGAGGLGRLHATLSPTGAVPSFVDGG